MISAAAFRPPILAQRGTSLTRKLFLHDFIRFHLARVELLEFNSRIIKSWTDTRSGTEIRSPAWPGIRRWIGSAQHNPFGVRVLRWWYLHAGRDPPLKRIQAFRTGAQEGSGPSKVISLIFTQRLRHQWCTPSLHCPYHRCWYTTNI